MIDGSPLSQEPSIPKERLTPKQSRFVEEYLVDGNATQAAVRAGYSQKTAREIGCENLTKPHIHGALRDARRVVSEKTRLTVEWVETRLMLVAERCLQHEPVVDRNGNPTGEYRFDAAGANRALELLGKRLKMFDESEPKPEPFNQFFANVPPQLLLELARKIREKERDEGRRQDDDLIELESPT